MTTNDLTIAAEVTPNPNTLKFNVNRVLIESGSLNFPDREKAKGSAIERLFDIDQVLGVMIGRDFITVTKNPQATWQTMAQPVSEGIRSVLKTEGALFQGHAAISEGQTQAPAGNYSEIERKIREILDNEIRPAVAMDGGDIQFYGYQDGVVTLHLQGSCSSCPSSIMTLKMGVENRLKALIPEVREVVQV